MAAVYMSCEVGLQTEWLLLTAFDLASVAPVVLPVEVFTILRVNIFH